MNALLYLHQAWKGIEESTHPQDAVLVVTVFGKAKLGLHPPSALFWS